MLRALPGRLSAENVDSSERKVFVGIERASDETSLSLGGRGLKSKAGRQARLLEEAAAP